MIEPSTPSEAVFEAAVRTAEAEALMAGSAFGSALRASPEFTRLAEAGERLEQDAEATMAIKAFGQRQTELRMQLTLGALDASQQDGLDRLEAAMLACPSVAAYVTAEEAFRSICRETAAVVSAQIGIDFAANCSSGGCCT